MKQMLHIGCLIKNSNGMKHLLLIIASSFVFACKKNEAISSCITEKIEQFKTNGCASAVNSYNFNGQIVYTFEGTRCFISTPITVWNNQCQYIGTIGDNINWNDFSQNATLINTIWTR